MPDLDAIRKEYEAGGGSLRQLADRHGIAKTTLSERAAKEGWVRPSVRPSTQNLDRTDETSERIRVLRSELPSPPSAVRGANLIVDAIVGILEQKAKEKDTLDIAEYLKASSALSQCNRIIVNAPPEKAGEDQEDLTGFSEDELRQYAEYQERAKKRA